MKSRLVTLALGGLVLFCGCARKGTIEEYFVRRNGECDDIKQQQNPDGTILVYGCDKAETYRCFQTKKFAGYYYQRVYSDRPDYATQDELLYDRLGNPVINDTGDGYRRVPMYAPSYTCGAVEPKQPKSPAAPATVSASPPSK